MKALENKRLEMEIECAFKQVFGTRFNVCVGIYYGNPCLETTDVITFDSDAKLLRLADILGCEEVVPYFNISRAGNVGTQFRFKYPKGWSNE